MESKKEIRHEIEIEKFELLKIELQLLQSRFDKYDKIFFINRNWAITIIVALVGVVFSNKSQNNRLLDIASFVGFFFFLVELFWRARYMDKIRGRYRYLRDKMNQNEDKKITIESIYDLGNSLIEKHSSWCSFVENLRKRKEICFFYVFVIIMPQICKLFI